MPQESGFTPEEALISEWVQKLQPLKERYPTLATVDLVVEGGVGTGRIMSHVAHKLFPKAVYVGTDISSDLMTEKRRLFGEIDDEALNLVLQANEDPFDPGRTIVFGNCFDVDLIQDIAQKVGAQNPLLVSHNGMASLTTKDVNHFEKKRSRDRHSINHIVHQTPYNVQLHVSSNEGYQVWAGKDKAEFFMFNGYYQLEEEAQKAGYTTERLDNGLFFEK